jgi:pSer/pThr/pTyr-binding forkhead associated (FHA) protein
MMSAASLTGNIGPTEPIHLSANLKLVSGSLSGALIPIPPGELLIGRDADCQLQLESAFVSRHHCVLLRDGSLLRIRDLGSKNGTFVNGHRVGSQATIVQHNDLVSVGEATFQTELAAEAIAANSQISAAPDNMSSPASFGRACFDGDTL